VSDPTPRSRSILEFSVILDVIGVAAAFFLDGFYYAQEQAERTVMEATVRNMNSGLRMEVATRIINGREATIGELVGANPVQWLENPPAGYSGTCQQELVRGGWCFDTVDREIVYQPRVDRHLRYLEPVRPGLRWRVSSAAEMAGRPSSGLGLVGAIGVFSTTLFAWR
jgi:hypothetical protein